MSKSRFIVIGVICSLGVLAFETSWTLSANAQQTQRCRKSRLDVNAPRIKTGAKFEASFAPWNSRDIPPSIALKKPLAKRGRGKLEFSFRFKNAPWKIVLERFARKAGLVLQNGNIPQGTFSYYDPHLYTSAETLDVLAGVLIAKEKHLLVRSNHSLVLHNLAKPVPPKLVPSVTVEDISNRGRNELMRLTLQVRDDIDVEEIAKDIKALVRERFAGQVVYSKAKRTITVTEFGSTLRRILAYRIFRG